MKIDGRHWITALALFAVGFPAEAAAPCKLAVTKTGRRIEIAGRLPAGIRAVEVRIESARNATVSRFTDVSPLQPARWKVSGGAVARDTWYPVVDIVPEEGLEGVAVFSRVPRAICAVNGMFHRERKPLGTEVVIPAERLEFWENSIWVDSRESHLRSFYLRQRVTVSGPRFKRAYETLAEDWSGRVSLITTGEGAEICGASIEAVPAAAAPVRGRNLDRQRLIDSLAATVEFTLRAQNRNPRSPTSGGLFLFYDADAATYRTSHWLWGWGPSVKMLLDAASIPEVSQRAGSARVRRVAGEIGAATLRFIVREPGHINEGIPVSRWDQPSMHDYGYREIISPSDAGFLAGWAWIPLYEATGDKNYLEATRNLARALDRLIQEFGLIPQNYYPDTRSWSDNTADESGFGTEGLAELYRVTGDARYREIGRRYIEAHLEKLQRPDGLWDRSWSRKRAVATPTPRHTRGMGWAMEGLLASHRMMPEGKYLRLARRMAEHLLETQNSAGYWTFHFDKPEEEVGIAEKGTALWSLLLYRLYRHTRDQRHLAGARKALAWLIDRQYNGPDPQARGGVLGSSPNSGVRYRPWFRLACTYTSGFFGLAVMEELQISGEQR